MIKKCCNNIFFFANSYFHAHFDQLKLSFGNSRQLAIIDYQKEIYLSSSRFIQAIVLVEIFVTVFLGLLLVLVLFTQDSKE